MIMFISHICSKTIFNILRYLQQSSVQTIALLLLYALTANYLPLISHQILYTISMFIKDILILLMPITVGCFLASSIISFEKKAPLFIILIIIFEILSNFSSVWYAFVTASLISEQVPQYNNQVFISSFTYLWRLDINTPSWWSASTGSMVGVCLGITAAYLQTNILTGTVKTGKYIMEWLLTKVFARLIPVFVLGFTANMHQAQLLNKIISHYLVLILWLTGFLLCYILLLFMLGAGFSIKRCLCHIRNLLPAGGISLLSGCSLSTMPWTIIGAAKNLREPKLATAIIPATTNIQQIGDCIANSFLCFLVYQDFYGHSPHIITWLNFSIIFVLARFATAAVLGGAVFIMLPIYESYLSFNGEMIAIILTLNVVLDPIITSCNVMANGALCRVFEHVWHVIKYFRVLVRLRLSKSYYLGE